MKISIIVPVYKDQKNLDLFLNKIHLQTNKSYELILVVDTNLENVLSVVDSYKEKFKSKLKLIFNTKRVSRISAINMGISISTGDYLIINSIQNHFNNKLIEEILSIISNNKSDVIEFKCSFSKPFKFNGKIRKQFKDETLIEKHPEIHAFSYSFDFNKIYKTEILKIAKKFTFPVQDNSRYSIEINYKALLVAKTYSTVNKTLIISNGVISQNFNPFKLIRQWEAMINSLATNRNDIETSRYIYAQYFFEVVFMSAIICLLKNKILIKKFENKFKKQEKEDFKDLFQDNKYANMNSEEKNILFKKINSSIWKKSKIYKEVG